MPEDVERSLSQWVACVQDDHPGVPGLLDWNYSFISIPAHIPAEAEWTPIPQTVLTFSIQNSAVSLSSKPNRKKKAYLLVWAIIVNCLKQYNGCKPRMGEDPSVKMLKEIYRFIFLDNDMHDYVYPTLTQRFLGCFSVFLCTLFLNWWINQLVTKKQLVKYIYGLYWKARAKMFPKSKMLDIRNSNKIII